MNSLAPNTGPILTAYANGTSLNDIAVVYGSSANTVRKLLLDNGVTLRPRGRKGKSGLKQLPSSQITVEQRTEWEDKKRALGDDAKCELCERPTSKLLIDHNHTTGIVRGLICRQCNVGIGCFNDSVELLQKVVQYLTPPKPKDK